MDAATEPRVIVRASSGLGRLTLNRPRALNALDLGMVRTLAASLDVWEGDPDVGLVLLDGAGERGSAPVVTCGGSPSRSAAAIPTQRASSSATSTR